MTQTKANLLRRLRTNTRDRKLLDENRDELIRLASQAGATGDEIAAAADISKSRVSQIAPKRKR
jgi:DNA-directed RNA polymerase specialized sigma subunit